eukprot:TRINITY_DN24807_c0_g1_i1.p1 TRINITY_DN24807_c0_g1~~TRINITY_DN24807_c0_g1_i1.p1  ORF type:complete len:332 (+),score=112.02 TRINITY_DN24807_c0_g1_i1:122-1117(+)
MGNVLKSSADVQRRANKAFADPRAWQRVDSMEQRSIETNRNMSRFNVHGADKHSLEQLMRMKGRVDADEWAEAMEKIEKEHGKSSVAPEEVTMALRMNLYQQRQYLSYKDTMMRMGIPQDSVLSLEKWQDDHLAPLDHETRDVYDSYSDRIFSLELVQNPDDDPNHHDTFAGVEEGDNRVTERMLTELCMLRQENKIDYDAAGRELNRDGEVLRRITASIRIPPPLTTFDPNVDPETMFQLAHTGKEDVQKETYKRNIKQFFRKMSGPSPANATDRPGLGVRTSPDGWGPQDIPVHGFQSPGERFKQRGSTAGSPLGSFDPDKPTAGNDRN